MNGNNAAHFCHELKADGVVLFLRYFFLPFSGRILAISKVWAKGIQYRELYILFEYE